MDLKEGHTETDQLEYCTLEGSLCWIGRHYSVLQIHGEIGLTGG